MVHIIAQAGYSNCKPFRLLWLKAEGLCAEVLGV